MIRWPLKSADGSRVFGSAAYSSASASLANAILSGVAQGLQPLWGQCYGKRDTVGMNWYFRSGVIINIVLSVLIDAGLFFFDVPVICIFNQEEELIRNASAALPLFSLSFIPMALNLIYTAFLFSTKRTGDANIIALSRGVAVKALAVFLMPSIWGTDAIWLAPLVSEIVTLILAVGLSKKNRSVCR